MRRILCLIICGILSFSGEKNSICVAQKTVLPDVMKKVYDEVKTPYKYGIVLKHPDSSKLIDSPTIFRVDNRWYMTYIVFDGRGYETWLAESTDLLSWNVKGKILPFTSNTWDSEQKAGYVALVDIDWGGSYEVEKFKNKYWLSYLGGATSGYEAGTLAIGIANTTTLTEAKEWNRINSPVLKPTDKDARWFDNQTIYKSSVIHDKNLITGSPFVMYYNAKGEGDFESIGIAVSKDMVTWERTGNDPLITKKIKGSICGDAQIVKMNNIYVMFYFGAFWEPNNSIASEKFACSYDLINWKEWEGKDLVEPSEPYDEQYAHKPWVVKWNGVVYHFYNAVGKSGRVIALATSKDLKK